VHHALILIIGEIFEKRFIFDSYASRIGKGTHSAVQRFEKFMRKVSCNGQVLEKGMNANFVKGYVLKADIKHYFQTVDHDVLIGILERRIKDGKVIWLVQRILENGFSAGKGMPLGNYTSQFFANVYLNELDYFVKHFLKARYYLRYVDDFVILHKRKRFLEYCLKRIAQYLLCLKVELHPDKSKVFSLACGVDLLGYKIFYYYKLVRRRNFMRFYQEFLGRRELYLCGEITRNEFLASLQGWFGYVCWADSYNLLRRVLNQTC